MDPKCMRCGTCCRNYLCLVPMYLDSDLSEDHLDKLVREHNYEYMQNYITENAIDQGEKCKWLEQNSHITYDGGHNDVAVCTAYDRRCSMCVNHNIDQWCNLGLTTWKKHQDEGNKIPEQIMEIIKQHPMYKYIFEEK